MEYRISRTNLHIIDSWQLTDELEQMMYLHRIRVLNPQCQVLQERSLESLVREWRAHNRLYRLGLWKEHTKDVDLNWPQKWYVRLAYWIIGIKLFNE